MCRVLIGACKNVVCIKSWAVIGINKILVINIMQLKKYYQMGLVVAHEFKLILAMS